MLPRIHDIAILRASPSSASSVARDPNLKLVEFGDDRSTEILAVHEQLGRTVPPSRIARRFSHGLRFFELVRESQALGSTWAAIGRPRYIDEIGLSFPLLDDEIWLRDVFVSPAARGMKLFAQMLPLLLEQSPKRVRTIWSDVDWSNDQSRRAHSSSGFEIRARLRALDIGRRIRLRGAPPAWHLPLADLEPARRVILWDDTLRKRHAALIA